MAIPKAVLPVMFMAQMLALFSAASVLGAAPERKGPLADLPSPPGPHMQKIRDLEDGECLVLASPAPDPKWGSACARSWGAYALIFAPDLGGAFFFGEGPHGHVKPDGYAMDDLWFLDLNANRWICLHPGTSPATFSQDVASGKLKADKLGRLVDNTSQPIPVHTHIHAWGYLAYDTHRHEFAFWRPTGPKIDTYYLAGRAQMEPGLKQLAEQGLGGKHGVWSPWIYEAYSGRFDLRTAKGSFGGAQGGFPQFRYVPQKKLFYAVSGMAVASFDPAENRWTALKAKGKGPGGFDTPGCLDSKRLRIHHGPHVYFDLQAEAWVRIQAEGPKPDLFNTNQGYFGYDERNDRVVVFQRAEGKEHPKGGLFVYDPNTNSWTGGQPVPKGMSKSICYDPANNVFWSFGGPDGKPKPSTFAAWRYRRKQE